MKKKWRQAQRHLAGGVNSPVRAFQAVGGTPIFMRQGLGPLLYDATGKAYIDYCLSWGAILFGHADHEEVQAIQLQAARGTSFGTVTEYETMLAQEIKKAFPGMERIRFTSSGTEAVMSAVRLARGVTGKDRLVKFEGCYHGHADGLLVKAGSGLATFGAPSSQGIPKSVAALTTVLPYNDTETLQRFFKKQNDVACVIVEPVAGNMGVVPADKKFLETLRKETLRNGALLIFDEVITGFRVGFGGAQHLYGIQPDITILGKIIGGGLPIGAFGAKKSLMDALSPSGGVYQAGTLSGNPLSMAAGRSVLSRLSKIFYDTLHQKTAHFLNQVRWTLKKKKAPFIVENVGSMFTVFFGKKAPRNFREVCATDVQRFNKFFHQMLKSGIYLPPSAFEACFISAAHTETEFRKTLEVLKRC